MPVSFIFIAGIFVSGTLASGLSVSEVLVSGILVSGGAVSNFASGDATGGGSSGVGLLMPGMLSCDCWFCADTGEHANGTSKARARILLRIVSPIVLTLKDANSFCNRREVTPGYGRNGGHGMRYELSSLALT
jgi:hypothetical protein